LVGNKRSEPIVEGLREGKFDEQNIYVVADLNAATAKLAELSKIGDVILFENDLPDSYNE
jgi:UDP-N-acetylmuramoyl-tripeptide--D-alanyl-D-alanine ligase